MKTLSIFCAVCLWIAGFSAFAHAQAPLRAGMPSGITALDPQILQAINAFLEAANTGDPEKAAACVYFEDEAERARFVGELRQRMEPAVQNGRWQGACFQKLEPLNDGSGGFWLQYGLCKKSEFGTTQVDGTSLSVQRVGDVWKVHGFYTYKKGSFIISTFKRTPDPLQRKVQELDKENSAAPWVAAMEQTRSLSSTQSLPLEDRARNTPVMRASADIIRTVQGFLPDADKSSIFLFIFNEAGGQLTLLGSLPLRGKTPEDNPQAYRLKDGVSAGYRITEWEEGKSVVLSLAVQYAYKNLDKNTVMTLLPRRISLPSDALYPLMVPRIFDAGQKPEKSDLVFVLAHLPLTENAVMMERSAVLPEKDISAASAKRLPPTAKP